MGSKVVIMAMLALSGFAACAGMSGLVGKGVVKAALSRTGRAETTAVATAGARAGMAQAGKRVATSAGASLAKAANITIRTGGASALERMSSKQILAVGGTAAMGITAGGGAVAMNRYAAAAADAKRGIAAATAENLTRDGELARKLVSDPNATPEQREWINGVGNRNRTIAESTQSASANLVGAILSSVIIVLASVAGVLCLLVFCPRWVRGLRRRHLCT